MNRRYKRISVMSLLRHQYMQKTALLRHGDKKVDVAGMILNVLLIGLFGFAFVYILSGFVQMYISVKVNLVVNVVDRVSELLTIGYTVVLLVCIVSGVIATNRELFDSQHISLYSAMPVPKHVIYGTALIWVYLGQLLATAVVLVPFNIIIGVVANMGSSYYLWTMVVILVLPLIAMSVSSIIALPIQWVSRRLGKYYMLTLLLSVVVLAGVFWLYMMVLEFLQQLLATGEIRFVFTAQLISKIMVITNMLVPAVWLSNITMGVEMLTSAIFIVAVVVIFFVVALLLGNKTYDMAVRTRLANNTSRYFSLPLPKASPMGALIRKEFVTVLRTPSYALQFFGVAIVLPLLVYLCLSLCNTLVVNLIYVDCSFELGVALTILFGSLTNTFCATNISREGDMIASLKAMPLAPKAIVGAKIAFCMIVTTLSNVANATVLWLATDLSLLEALFVLTVSILLSLAQVCYATRLDINRPSPAEDDSIIVSSTNVVSAVILVGMVSSLIVGGSAVYFSIVQNMLLQTGIIDSVVDSTIFTLIVVGSISVFMSILGVIFLYKGLDNKVANIGGVKGEE